MKWHCVYYNNEKRGRQCEMGKTHIVTTNKSKMRWRVEQSEWAHKWSRRKEMRVCRQIAICFFCFLQWMNIEQWTISFSRRLCTQLIYKSGRLHSVSCCSCCCCCFFMCSHKSQICFSNSQQRSNCFRQCQGDGDNWTMCTSVHRFCITIKLGQMFVPSFLFLLQHYFLVLHGTKP